MDSIFKHTILVNINNKVISHRVEDSNEYDKLDSDEGYVVTYSKITEMFRIVYYSKEDSRFKVESSVMKTFRNKCSLVNNGLFDKAIV